VLKLNLALSNFRVLPVQVIADVRGVLFNRVASQQLIIVLVVILLLHNVVPLIHNVQLVFSKLSHVPGVGMFLVIPVNVKVFLLNALEPST